MHFLTLLLPLLSILAVLASGNSAFGQSPWYEGFEEPEVSWREAGGDVRYRVLQHQRTGGAHNGQRCEWFQISTEDGTALYIAHDIGNPRVIEELLPTVWIRSDRPGLSISASVVLPRTINPATNKPLVTTLVGETKYSDVGRWQQLRLADLPKLLARQVRALRMQMGSNIDEREAYLNGIVLNIYGGPGVTNVWIDDLDIAGYVGRNGAPIGQVVSQAPQVGGMVVNNASGTYPSTTPGSLPKRFDIKLSGSVLMVDGKPIFPRAIEYQGEPLVKLKELGFNAVWLKRLPTQELLEEADRLGLWLICPPPRPMASLESPIDTIGPAFDRVLVWDLGHDLTSEQLPSTRRLVEQLQIADRRGGRPLICKPQSNLLGFSQLGNNDMTLLVDRRPLGTTMELKDYGTWVSRQPLVALPGTPMWTTVQTQPNEELRTQIAALDPNVPPPNYVSFEQMRLLAYTAVAAGSRGLIFLSSTPLDAADPATRQRVMSMELLNLELARIEPWAATGNYWDKAESSEKQITATVLRGERIGRLLLPIWSAQGAQCVPGQSAANNVLFKVPAVPEEYNAYELTAGGVHKLDAPRRTLGKWVTFNEFSLTSQVVLADDAVVSSVMRRSENIGQRVAMLDRELAVAKFNAVLAARKQLAQPPGSEKQLGVWTDSARKNLQMCDAQFAARNYPSASLNADRAMRALRLIERFFWDQEVNNEPLRRNGISPSTSPATLSFETLPLQAGLRARIARSRGPNLLPGGNFDDPAGLSGWQNIPSIIQGNDPGGSAMLQTSADLVQLAAHRGPMGLCLTVTPTTPETPPLMIETPPVRFISPMVQAQVGQLVCIHGWVKVPKPIAGSVDGLMIYDNQGGAALAERIGQTADWRQFVLYRIVTQPGGVNVTFALTGLGAAWIDDVGIEVLESATP